jgi:lysozyme family protein
MSYASALALTLEIEKLWYAGDRPSDPNPTMKGVTQNRYNKFRKENSLPWRSVREIEEKELQAIYYTYWVAAHCAELGPLAATVVFDHAVNASPEAAIRVMQAVTGVATDGRWGPKTAAAVQGWVGEDVSFATALCWARLDHYYRLALSPRLRPNLTSWLDRVRKLYKVLELAPR